MRVRNIKDGINKVHNGTNVKQFDALAPSGLSLTVLSDTSIKLDWTNNSLNAEGHKIERSTDGANFTEIASVTGTTATYTNTGASDGTRYYYRVRAYKAASYSAYCAAANDWTAIKMVLTSTGSGAGVSTVRFQFATTNVLATLDGNGKWYSDSGGTANESTSYTFSAGSLVTRYLKVTSGTSNMLIFAKGNWIKWGETPNDGFVSTTNAASIAKNVANLTTLTHLVVKGLNTLSGSVANLTSLTQLDVQGQNTLSGSVANLTSLTILSVTGTNTLSGSVNNLTSLVTMYVQGANTLSGSITNIKSLTYLECRGNNTITGDLGGSGTTATANGLTNLYLDTCAIVDYTSGSTWTLTQSSLLNPSAGYGLSSTEVDNMLIDMAASLGTVSGKYITLKGSNAARTAASNSAVTTLNGKGWTIVTN